MKILLIVPRSLNPKQTYREYPLGAGILATALGRQGHEVLLYDQGVEGGDDEQVRERVREFGPGVVGFSVITPSYPVARRQIQAIREEFPETRIVAGGIHASLFPEDLLADGADAVVIGAGRQAMIALVERIEQGRSWAEVPGVAWRDGMGRAVLPAERGRRWSEEASEIVDRDVYNLPLYTHHSMQASIGCPYRCRFCCNFAGKVLQEGVLVRPIDELVEEMRYLVARYGAGRIFFVDDLFLVTGERVREFCRRLAAEGLPVEWIAQMRADAIDPGLAEAMAEANCRRISFGVEAGSEAILRRAGKGIGKEAIRRGIRAARAAGIRVKTGWVYGLPGTLAEQYEAIDFMRELRPHEISIHQLIPFPGTEYYERPAAHGLRIRDAKDFSSFCFGGLGDNISYDYLTRDELMALLERTVAALEAEGYTSSDRANGADDYIFSTPLNAMSMPVFRGAVEERLWSST